MRCIHGLITPWCAFCCARAPRIHRRYARRTLSPFRLAVRRKTAELRRMRKRKNPAA